MLPFETRQRLYQAFITPHFNYCAESWHFCSKRLTEKLEKVNERALRFVYRDQSSTYEALLKQNKSNTLRNQRLTKILNTVYRVVNKQNISATISSLVTPRYCQYNLRGDSLLSLPKVNTTNYGLKSWTYQAARLWNALPNNFRCINKYNSFKKDVSKLDLAGF